MSSCLARPARMASVHDRQEFNQQVDEGIASMVGRVERRYDYPRIYVRVSCRERAAADYCHFAYLLPFVCDSDILRIFWLYMPMMSGSEISASRLHRPRLC